MENLNTVDILLSIDKGDFKPEEKVIKINSLSKLAKKDVTFKIKELKLEEFKRAQEIGTIKKRHGKVDFDDIKYGVEIILKGVVEPSLKDEKLLTHYGVETPKELVLKILKAGEIADICQSIEDLSGYRQDLEEVEEENKEIKN